MPEIIAGTAITAVCVTEPDAGSDVKGIRTTARRDGDRLVLNGSKMFITNGVHADVYFVAAKTVMPGARPQQIGAMHPGGERHAGLSRRPRARQARLALVDTAELVFEDCRVPDAAVLGEEGRGFYAIMSQLPERAHRASARWRWARRRPRSI